MQLFPFQLCYIWWLHWCFRIAKISNIFFKTTYSVGTWNRILNIPFIIWTWSISAPQTTGSLPIIQNINIFDRNIVQFTLIQRRVERLCSNLFWHIISRGIWLNLWNSVKRYHFRNGWLSIHSLSFVMHFNDIIKVLLRFRHILNDLSLNPSLSFRYILVKSLCVWTYFDNDGLVFIFHFVPLGS